MKAVSYHFLIGSHAVDLLRLGLLAAAEQRQTGEASRPLVVATFGGAAVAAASGWSLPPTYQGLAGCGGRAEHLGEAVLAAPHPVGPEVSVILPPAHDLPAAESLDRAREPLAGLAHDLVFVTLARSRLGTDLPPLEPADEVSCFWELGDLHPRPGGAGFPTGFDDVAERLACQSARFHGVHLYSRNARRREQLRPWVETIRRSTGGRLVSEHVLVLGENEPAVTVVAPAAA